jgi:quinol monooxygenase YgiN
MKKITMLTLMLSLSLFNSALGQSDQSVQATGMTSTTSESSLSNTASPIILISHVDVMPNYAAAAVQLLKRYHADSMKEKGATKVQIFQQIGRPNHFTIVEEWLTEGDYNDHVSSSRTRSFRDTLQPMLGSPYDERPHKSLDN